MSRLVIFVKASKTSIKLLRFIDENIHRINHLGAVIAVEKVSGSSAEEACKKRGFTRLPAMIDERGKVHVGADQIIAVFKRNLGTPKKDNIMDNVYGVDEATPEDDTRAFFYRQMYQEDENGQPAPIVDDGEDDLEEGGAVDYSREMSRFKTKTKSHRRKGRETRQKRPPRREEVAESDEEVSEEDEPHNEIIPRKGKRDMGFENDLDNRMLAAFADKI